MKYYRSLIFFFICLLTIHAFGKQENANNKYLQNKSAAFDHAKFDGNSISSWLENDGLVVSHRITGNCGMEWPKGSGKAIDFCSGLWIIGQDPDGHVRTACAEYSSEFQPGIILQNGQPDDPFNPIYRIYKINSDGTGDWDNWPFDTGAPALKAKDGSDSLDTEGQKIPRLVGDQTLWWVMNDAQAEIHDNIFCTQPFGIEVHVLVYGFNDPPLSDVMFIEWTIKNKSETDYDSVYVSLFDDADVGDASDDAAGCDSSLSLGYFYNDRIVDATYDAFVPALGFVLLQGANSGTIESPNYLPMTSFSYFWGGAPDPYCDPSNALEAYNFVKGQLADGSFWQTPQGQNTVFPLDGDPWSGEGWIHKGRGDRRGLVSSGPFTLPAGSQQIIRGAKVIALGCNNLHSVFELKRLSQWLFNFDARLYKKTMAKKPVVYMQVKQTNSYPELFWNDVDKEVENSNLHFLGYVLYQINDQGELMEIDRFDKIDGITEIKDLVNNSETVVYFGDENGLQTSKIIEWDIFTGQPFEYAKEYTFTIRVFVYDEFAEPGKKVLSNELESIRYIHLPENYQSRHTAKHVAGNGAGSVTMTIYNPSLLNDHRYRITFESGSPPVVTIRDYNTGHFIDSFPNTQYSYQIVLDSVGVILDIVNKVGIKELKVTGYPWLLNLDERLMIGFVGWLDPNILHFNNFPAVLIEFQDAASVEQEGYWSKGVIWPIRGDEAKVGELPLRAFDISSSPKRQLNVGFNEDASSVILNGIWDLGWDGSHYQFVGSSPERLVVLNSDYDSGATVEPEFDMWDVAVCYYYVPQVSDSLPYLANTFSLEIQPYRGLFPGDIFDVVASIYEVEEKVNAKQMDFRLRQNYPNPFNVLTRIEYQVKAESFIQIDIYDILGRHIETMVEEKKLSGSYYQTWSAAQHPSGIYFVKMRADGIDLYCRKMALIK